MKRQVVAVIMLMLLLAGCTGPASPPRAPVTAPASKAPATASPGAPDAAAVQPAPGGAAGSIAVHDLSPAALISLHRKLDGAAALLGAGDFRGALAALPPQPPEETYARQRWFALRAEGLAATGDPAGAADAADAAMGLALGAELLPARVTAGDMAAAAGLTVRAARAYLDAAGSTAALYDGALRRSLLQKLMALSPGLDPGDGEQQELLLRIGLLLERFQMHDEAIGLYRRDGWHGDGLIEAQLSIAWNLGELRQREQAAALFRAIIRPDRHEVRLRTLLGEQLVRLGLAGDAETEFARALAASETRLEDETSRVSRHTARALERLIDMSLDAGNIAGAYRWLVRAPSGTFRFPDGERAAWEVFLAAYARGGAGDPLVLPALLMAEQGSVGSEYLYWRWRVAGEAGEKADLLMRVLLYDHPLTYYGLLGRRLTERTECAACFMLDLPPNVTRPVQRLAGPLALWEAGLQDAARGELRRHLRYNRGDWESQYLLAEWEAAPGRYRESISLAWQAWQESLQRLPPLPVLRLLYPAPYREIVEAEARRFDLDPLFLFSLMREESSFEARALSTSNAHGLLQLLPSTAEWQAERIRLRPYGTEMLFDPAINVRLGAAFVRWLLDYFDGDYTLAAAAYNAGPGAVDRWIDRYGTADMILFIEQIPYRETREYVRRVERNRQIYQVLWGE